LTCINTGKTLKAHINDEKLINIASLISAERVFIMQLLINLFSTDYGLQSLAVIVFILGMCVWFALYFKRHIEEDSKKAGEK
jgi:hypothetical protein